MRHILLLALTVSSVLPSLNASVAVSHSETRIANFSSPTELSTNKDDEGEARELLPASVFDKAKKIFSSSAVTSDKLQKWLGDGKNADTVFSRMGLTKAGGRLFHQPQFAEWIKYVDDLNAKYPAKATSAIPTLTNQFGDDALYKLLEFTKKNPRQEKLANRLQTEQMQHWATVGKPPDDVFLLFGLQRVGESLLTNSKFTSWVAYVDDLNALNAKKTTSMIPTLTPYYGDDVLFKMVNAAKNSDATKSIATKLEAQQLQGWLKSGKTPDNAFVQMGVGKVRDNFMASPLFSTWVKYLDDFNAQYPAKETTAFHVLTRRFKDESLAKIIAVGKTHASSKMAATKLETQQMQAWLASGKSSDDVFTVLKLNKAEDNFFDNPLYKTWSSYMNIFNKGNPGKETNLFKTLTAHYSDKPLIKILEAAKKVPNLENTAGKLQTEKIQGYLAIKKNPDEVFNLLGLGDAWYNVLGNPLFKTWLNYVKTFDRETPAKKTDWFLSLHKSYQDNGVEAMIDKALRHPSTVKYANMVQAGQVKRWLLNEDPPHFVFKWILRYPKWDDNVLPDPRFKTWAKYLGDFNQRYPDKKATMIDGLRASFNDRALLEMFDAAKKIPSTEKLATNLQNALLNKWVRAKEDPAELSKMLRDVVTADGMIQRYIKKANVVWGNIV